MEPALLIGGLTVVVGGSIIGFFVTKTAGFGKFNTAVLLLILVLYIGGVAFAVGQIQVVSLANLLFAVAGYAGGLLTDQGKKKPKKSAPENNQQAGSQKSN